jgi:acyl-CoA hydrolase
MPSIAETKRQMIQFVFPEHASVHNRLSGGRLMDWIMQAATIDSSLISKGITVLGATDSIDFLTPVMVGEIVTLESWVEYIGSSSMEIGVKVYSENPETGDQKLTTSSHLAFVAVDKNGKPRKIAEKITPSNSEEMAIYIEAKKRKDERLTQVAKRDNQARNVIDETEIVREHLETTKVVLPEDTFHGDFMAVGKLMMDIDQAASILAMRFVKGVMITGSLDDLYFYSPIRIGDIITFKAGITYVGQSSLEVGIKVLSENVLTGEQRHTCTAFLSFVHIAEDGTTKPVPEFDPETPEEKRLWRRALERKDFRSERVKGIKSNDEY